MPGAGKTYWGRRLAIAYGLKFVDLDTFIEEREGKSVTEIFETIGEAGFRINEAEALQDVIADSKSTKIIACGGGTPVFGDNLRLMKETGCVVYLRAELSILAQRLAGELDRRPLLTRDPFLLPTLQQMLDARESFYEQAHYIFDVENLSLTNFEQIIASCTKPH
jgi:shikimate kinase